MDENLSFQEREKAEEAMIQQAFRELLDDYLHTKHRKRVEITPQEGRNHYQGIQLCQPGTQGHQATLG